MKTGSDILAIGAHPDDIELSCGGTLAKAISQGKSVALLDLTQGEMGTRGTVAIRQKEAQRALKALGAKDRWNLKLRDGHLLNDESSQMRLIEVIRSCRPKLVICNAPTDRHPDHGHASALVVEACFKAGFAKLPSQMDGQAQEPFRPARIMHYIQFTQLHPDVVVDITGFVQVKMDAILAHTSQFYDPNSQEPETLIASKGFLEAVTHRDREWGRSIGVHSAEGFIAASQVGIDAITDLI
ncbi:MAG: bacillithiol biosynthesis deacetylase BshB1 [Schleiferiaceae bacterium]|nr:bacillithiol biosynthesis deacetylase BshB1 [Schleiferiaceae bacterium]